jgi:adenylate kinase
VSARNSHSPTQNHTRSRVFFVETVWRVGYVSTAMHPVDSPTAVIAEPQPTLKAEVRARPTYRTLLIFGPPGSGKGTQGNVLGMVPRFVHFACGEVFRSLDTRTKLGQAFLYYSSRGELVPDELTVELWHEHIDKMVDAGRFKPDIDVLVLDGIPRNVQQAQFMEQHIVVEKVFHLTCPDRSRLITRLKKRALKDNRLDDANEEVIRKRLQTYEDESRPLLDYYQPRGVIQTIDATQPPVAVLSDILHGIIKLSNLPAV